MEDMKTYKRLHQDILSIDINFQLKMKYVTISTALAIALGKIKRQLNPNTHKTTVDLTEKFFCF